jgi:hypothetical protein
MTLTRTLIWVTSSLLLLGCSTSGKVDTLFTPTLEPPAPKWCVDYCQETWGGTATYDWCNCTCTVNGIGYTAPSSCGVYVYQEIEEMTK